MLTDEQIQEAAKRFDEAERTRRQVRPLTFDFPEIDMADAHAVQDAWVAMKLARGARIRGRKIGLTSKAMQRAMNIGEPDYGTLLDDMFFHDGAEIETASFLDPRVEVEISFVLQDSLQGTEVSVDQVLDATEAVYPSLELIAARSYRIDPESGKTRTVVDTIADNAASAGVVLGTRGFDPREVDLPWCGAALYRNGEVEETGLAAAVMGHPAHGVCWLARRFAVHGIALTPGDVILSGSFTRPVAARAGDCFLADFGPLGRIGCRFV
ncbi:MAG: 2-oxo-hepta-3-ene-1,7-dioic acid hydratase [Gammaproteobacteria bacterium]|nr:2-oxo-hepta-3-ene-1,7-dioic acid hydratase [Gammaproteobacteria bacterium]